jgi:sulfur carrier protein ThiS
VDKSDALIILKSKTIPCRSNIPVWRAMEENGLSRSGHLIIRGTQLITDDEIIRPGEELELIPVISGG